MKKEIHRSRIFSLTVCTFSNKTQGILPSAPENCFKYLHDKLKMSCIYTNLQGFIHLKQWDGVCAVDCEGESSSETERERRSRKPFELTVYPSHGKPGGYFRTQKYLVALLLYLKRTSYYQILILFEGNYQHGGKAVLYIHVCPHLQLHADENICALVTASLKPEGNDGAVRWWEISFPLCIVWLLLFDIQCGDINKDART